MTRRRVVDAETLARFDREIAETWRKELGEDTVRRTAGIDEAGRGPLAGPVVAAAVVFHEDDTIEGLDDSKRLTAARREALYDTIRERARAVGVGIADAEIVDQINVLNATRHAVKLALAQIKTHCNPTLLLLDALKLEDDPRPQIPIIKGDQQSQSIAAASVIAKVTRDRLMIRYDAEYPDYGFAQHKGYGTQTHLDALAEKGPTTIHRLSFQGVCFFDQRCRHSRTFHELQARYGPGGPDHSDSAGLNRELVDLKGFLPRREIDKLEDLLR